MKASIRRRSRLVGRAPRLTGFSSRGGGGGVRSSYNVRATLADTRRSTAPRTRTTTTRPRLAVMTSSFATGRAAFRARLPLTRTLPASTSFAESVRVFTSRAHHSHLSSRCASTDHHRSGRRARLRFRSASAAKGECSVETGLCPGAGGQGGCFRWSRGPLPAGGLPR